jgi:hypothetical protein
MESWAVMLSKPESLDPRALSKAWAEFRGIPLADAVREARGFWGILGVGLGNAEARRMNEWFSGHGWETRCVPSEKMITALPAAEEVCKCEFHPDHLIVHLVGGTAGKMPWSHIGLLAAAAIKHTITKTTTVEKGPSAAQQLLNAGLFMATGLPIKLGGSKRVETKTREETDQLFYLDLLSADGSQHWRIGAQDFDYSCLKDKKLSSSWGILNFCFRTWPRGRRMPGRTAVRGCC